MDDISLMGIEETQECYHLLFLVKVDRKLALLIGINGDKGNDNMDDGTDGCQLEFIEDIIYLNTTEFII